MPYLSIHIHTREKKLMGEPCILMVYYVHENENGCIGRWLAHRGVTDPFVAVRPCSQEEHDEYAHHARYNALRYGSWEALINDERKYCTEPAWHDTLNALRAKYKAFDVPHVPEAVVTKIVAYQPTLF